MTTPLSLIARKARMLGLRNALDGGAALFYTDTPPAKSSDTTASLLLCTITFATPCGTVGESGELATLVLATPDAPLTGNAVASSLVGWVRLVDGAGNGFMDLPVGLALPPGSTDTPAPVIVNALQLFTGGEILLLSCVLAD